MTTTKTPGKGLKDQIKDPVPSIQQSIRRQIQESIKEAGVGAEDILSELVWPFIGINAPVHHSFENDAPPSGSDVVLQDLIVHFANRENLKAWPEKYHAEILTTLYHLQKMFTAFKKYNGPLFHCANLHLATQLTGDEKDLHDDLASWYTV